MKRSRQKRAEKLLEDWAYNVLGSESVVPMYNKNPLSDMIDTTSRTDSQEFRQKRPVIIKLEGSKEKLQSQAQITDNYRGGLSGEIRGNNTRSKSGSKPLVPGTTIIGRDQKIQQLDAILNSKFRRRILLNILVRYVLYYQSEYEVSKLLGITRTTLQSQRKKAVLLAETLV